MQTRTYQVVDLVVPLNGPECSEEATTPECPAAGQKRPTIEQRLIRLITATVRPHTWADNGGPGTIDYYPLGMALVVNQTPEVQEEIAALLDGLRRLQDWQVAVDVRFLTVTDELYQRLAPTVGLDP